MRTKRFRDLLDADGILVGLWACDLENLADGPEHVTTVATLNIPLHGAFLRRGSGGQELVDPLTCSFSNVGDTWRSRHPARCRDTGIYVTFAPGRLTEPFENSFRRLSPARWLDWRVHAETLRALPQAAAVDATLLLVERELATEATPPCIELARDARARLGRRDARDVTTVAAELGVSPFVLCRSFRRATGTTAHAWLDRMRAIRAADAILAGATDLALLAVEVGFAHHSHLTARLRRVFGYTPTQLRARVARTDLARM
ncbi:MAG: helix-turn-helix transcriptional regulator [Myxococcota bacterium]